MLDCWTSWDYTTPSPFDQKTPLPSVTSLHIRITSQWSLYLWLGLVLTCHPKLSLSLYVPLSSSVPSFMTDRAIRLVCATHVRLFLDLSLFLVLFWYGYNFLSLFPSILSLQYAFSLLPVVVKQISSFFHFLYLISLKLCLVVT